MLSHNNLGNKSIHGFKLLIECLKSVIIDYRLILHEGSLFSERY